MPYHIYLLTPPSQSSTYLPHLIEHCVLWGIRDGKEYFEALQSSAESYTYYTCFTLDCETAQELDNFCDRICKNIPDNIIRYEAAVLKKEIAYPHYFGLLISKIGKHLYGPQYKYTETGRLSRQVLREYHAKFYQKQKFIVLERDNILHDIPLEWYCYHESFEVVIRWAREHVFVWDYNPEGLLVNELLQNLFDHYIEYAARYTTGEYFSNDTLAGEFEDRIFLSVDTKNNPLLRSIPTDFIAAFVASELARSDNSRYRDIDGPLMLKYGYTLSEKTKKEIIVGIGGYYEGWLDQM